MPMSSQPNGSSQTTSNSVQSATLPQNIQNYANTLDTNAFNIAQNGLGPYTGATYAGLPSGAYADIAGLQALPGQSQPAFNLASNTAANIASGYQTPQINPGQLANTNYQTYMDPYTQDVINAGVQGIQAQGQQSLNATADQARGAQAFGGSRQGVMEGADRAATNLGVGQLVAGQEQQNFQQAQTAAGTDIANNLTAQEQNAANANTSAGLQLSGANDLASIAGQGQTAQQNSLMAAIQAQALAQQDAQGYLTADQQQYSAEQQYPDQQEQLLMSVLAGTPYGSQTSTNTSGTTQQQAPGSPVMSGIGQGLGILGSIGSIASALPISDRRLKTDIETVGKDKKTGLKIYAYRYKDDPKTYPKVAGPMAQDIEKKYPSAVASIAGKKVIDPRFLQYVGHGQSVPKKSAAQRARRVA